MAEQMKQEAAGKTIPAGYKQTEVGVIPEDWEVAPIGSVLSITTGARNTQDKVDDGRYPFFVRSQTVERINTYSFDGEAVLTAGDGVGTGKIFHYVNGKFDFHQRVYLMYNFGERVSGYFFYLYFSNNFFERIMSMTAKSSVDSVRREMIADMKMVLPSKVEQTAIANVLSDSDALIGALEQLIAKKQAIKSATMQQLLTGRTRLPTFALHPDGTPKGYKPSELGEIPEDWEVSALSAICDVRDGTHDSPRYKDNGIPLVTSKNIVGDVLDLTNVSLISPEDAFEINKRSKVDKGDIIMSMIGTVGSAVLLNDEPDFCIKNVALFKPKRAIGEFLVQLIHSKHFQDYLEDCMDGGIQKFVSLGTLRNMEIVLPSIEEQTAIATILSDMDNELQALTQKLEKARALKQGMMQQLLTGKTRLPLAAGA
ncbi:MULTISPECIES: restriction endonuclease subunit S [Aeromonas]|uniref:restriction endonuclease subunit S n=1 Tax=Aeromonas TaxID=642 RepID=UPI000CDD0E62|nr:MULTISPECIES: restriction endonuclease subunit S [Aeromonas]AUZ75868.1 restriction endonuclease subunit S [Aeromonas sp. ASNIH4]POU29277.1 restriction endonuclease subunit S [Aeromonas hydrophila]POV85784.1 restriction endonuclease subunit S [Aeromonas sp. ASNIH6]